MRNARKACLLFAATALVGFVPVLSANAQAIRNNAGFNTNSLPPEDDAPSDFANLGFGHNINFFGNVQSSVWVNNNGNITFAAAYPNYTPFGLTALDVPAIIAPYFADVDTRNPASDVTKYGTDTIDGHTAFGVNWINVGYYGAHADKLNSFQLVMIDRSDIALGDFDFEYNFNQIQWETGDASGGVGGLGGISAAVGYSNGGTTPATNVSFQLPGSLVNGAFLDGNAATGLIHHSLNSTVLGRYDFSVRSGVVIGDVPEPGTVALLATSGVSGIALLRRRRQARK